MDEITNYKTFIKIEPINKGWSGDKKYYIETTSGERLLLRTADISEYELKKKEFELMKRISATGVDMSQPIDFGVCDGGKKVYQVLTWCDGEEAKVKLEALTEVEQYQFGVKAGELLRKLNSTEVSAPSSEWAEVYGKRIDGYIKKYRADGVTFEGDELLFSFLKNNHHLIENRPTCLTHEDFQTDNLVISPEGRLYVIDFQQCGIVDPYYALMSVMVSAETSPQFAVGQIREYFNGEPPMEFWDLCAFYIAAEQINVFTTGLSLGQEEREYVHKMMKDKMEGFDGLNDSIPAWYRNRSVS